jgi:hypothetical protein
VKNKCGTSDVLHYFIAEIVKTGTILKRVHHTQEIRNILSFKQIGSQSNCASENLKKITIKYTVNLRSHKMEGQ